MLRISPTAAGAIPATAIAAKASAVIAREGEDTVEVQTGSLTPPKKAGLAAGNSSTLLTFLPHHISVTTGIL